MSETTPEFNRYSLLNGMPVIDRGANDNKLTDMPFDSSQSYDHKKITNLPPSNGISTSSSRSSRDSSPLSSSRPSAEIGNILTQIPASQLPPSMQNRSTLPTNRIESGAGVPSAFKQPKNILLNPTTEHASQNILLTSAVNTPALITNSQYASKVQLIGSMPTSTVSSTSSSSHPQSSSFHVSSSSPLINNNKFQITPTLPPTKSSPLLNPISSSAITPSNVLASTVKTSLGQNNNDLEHLSTKKQEQYISQPLSAIGGDDTDNTLSGNNQQTSESFSNHSSNIATSQNNQFLHTLSSQSRSYTPNNTTSAPSNVPTQQVVKSTPNADINLQNKNMPGDSVSSKLPLEIATSGSGGNFDPILLQEPRKDLFSNVSTENKINSNQIVNQQYGQPTTLPATQQASTGMNLSNKQALNVNEIKQTPQQFSLKPVSQDNQKQQQTPPLMSSQNNNKNINQISPNLFSKENVPNNYTPPQMSSVSSNYRPQQILPAPPNQLHTSNFNQLPPPKVGQNITYPSNQQFIDPSKQTYKNSPLQHPLPTFPERSTYNFTPTSAGVPSSSQFQTPPTSYTHSPVPNKNMSQMHPQTTNVTSNMPPPLSSSQGFQTPTGIPNPPSSVQSNTPISRRYPTQVGYQQSPNQMKQMQQQAFNQQQYSLNQQQNVNYQPPPPSLQSPPPLHPSPSTQYAPPTSQQHKQHYGVSRNPPTTVAPPGYQSPNNYQNLNQEFGNLNITQTGFGRLWGMENFDLLQVRNILPLEKVEAPPIRLQPESLDTANCHPDIFRCTMTKIPENNSLLNKSRLPLGVLIHPFRDLNHLPVIQCSTIVRCRACRTYINPFVYFVDQKRWKCNLCYRVNELPEEFQYDPVSKSYGDPSRRPEIKSSTIEYIAPSEYMLRPPQPAVYLFLLDISSLAIESGYLKILCEVLTEELDNLPGDARTQVGFICYNSAIHFYSLGEGISQPHEMTIVDIDDIFLPSPDSLLVNLKERKELIKDLLAQLPTRFMNSHDNNSALGAALQAALKMMSPTGGRVSVFQCTLPTVGPGSLTSREIPANRANADVQYLNPSTDFYKRLALDCSAHQVAVDLFILNRHYIDLSTISGISRFSAGCIHHWPLFKASRTLQAQQFENCLRRYLTRKIGYEAVMRIRCTRGLSIHTFHGNFFVRSTDLLSLPNCNPDAGFGMQVAIEECLSDLQTVCFQAALLYTSSKGERRIRVHTLCLPIANTLTDVLNSADQQCIVGLVAKMAVDRSFQSSLSDARDAFINVVIDILSAYKLSLNQGANVNSSLLAPSSLKLLPLYIVALLKYVAFQTGTNIRLDDRVFAMCQMKTLPLQQLIQEIYPDLYPIHCLTDDGGFQTENGQIIPQPPRLQLSAEKLDSRGAFLLDHGHHMMIYVGHLASNEFLNNVLGFPHFAAIPDDCFELAKTGSPDNERLHLFINSLNDEKPYPATIQIIRDNNPLKKLFLDKLIEDRVETALSYYEFLQHLKTQVK